AGRGLRARRAVQACGGLVALAIALSPRRPRQPRARTTWRSAGRAPPAASCACGRGRGARSRDVVRGLGSTAHGAAPRPRPRAARGRAHGRRPRRPAAPSGWREQRMTRRGSGDAGVYRVHGMMQSYFTRKMTGYLDYKGIPWVFRRFAGASPEATAAGFPGGIPVVQTPAGEVMWDSTAMIHHLELRFPEPAVLPPDPVQRFICYVLEDVADE